MSLDLGKFGPVLPTESTNSLDMQKQLQTVGLPTPQNTNLQNKLVADKVVGNQTTTNFTPQQINTMVLGRSAAQVGTKKSHSSADLTEAELRALSMEVSSAINFFISDGETVGSGGYGASVRGDNPFALPFQDGGYEPTSRDSVKRAAYNQAAIDIQRYLQGDRDEVAIAAYNQAARDANEFTAGSRDSLDGTEVSKPSGYYKTRINWELTTVKRMGTGRPPVKFFVNPSTISYDLALTQSLDQVQRGYFLNIWKDVAKGRQNFFPMLKINFQFQSSNLLPETYQGKKIPGEETSTMHSQGSDSLIPPGLKNFFDIMSIFNEDRIIDGTLSESLVPFDGTPNYVIITISTRIFPKMALYGFFDNGLKFDEKAMDPLKFETNLEFLAFRTDPEWWNIDAIRSKYVSFWQGYFQGDVVDSNLETTPVETTSSYTPEDLEQMTRDNENQTNEVSDQNLSPGVTPSTANAVSSNPFELQPQESDPVTQPELTIVPETAKLAATPTPDQSAVADYMIGHSNEDKVQRDLSQPLSNMVPAGSTNVKYSPPVSESSIDPNIKKETVSYTDPSGNAVQSSRVTTPYGLNSSLFSQQKPDGTPSANMLVKFTTGPGATSMYYPNGQGNGVKVKG